MADKKSYTSWMNFGADVMSTFEGMSGGNEDAVIGILSAQAMEAGKVISELIQFGYEPYDIQLSPVSSLYSGEYWMVLSKNGVTCKRARDAQGELIIPSTVYNKTFVSSLVDVQGKLTDYVEFDIKGKKEDVQL